MIRSMTAYAHKTGTAAGLNWQWEMRSVNARGLDIRLRLPDGIEGLEIAVRSAIKDALTRGNVTVSLRLTRDEAAATLALDAAHLDRVLDALEHIQDHAASKGVTLAQPTAADVLATRGVVAQGTNETDEAALAVALKADILPLLADFVAMRETEGAALLSVINGQLDQIEALTKAARDAAEARRPEVAQALREAIARITEAGTDVSEDRLAQELALLAVKQDVTEEVDRLGAHISAARDMLAAPSSMGRKLDFLAQEFNREANTLCSKSQNAALTAIGLDLKALIDQMREQIQNVE